MSNRIHAVEIEGVGEVRWQHLSKADLEELRREAEQTVLPVTVDADTVFRGLLVSDRVILTPHFTNEEFRKRFAGRTDLLERVSQAILDRSG